MAWRDGIKVHPAADLFPMMSDAELDVLAKDIAENGLLHPIVWFRDQLIDGRNRVAAVSRIPDAKRRDEIVTAWRNGKDCIIHTMLFDPYAYVISANIHRRHLTAEQKRELIAKVVKAQPEKSDRQIAVETKTSHPKVARVRKKMEEAGDVERRSTRTDTKGRQQPAAKLPSAEQLVQKIARPVAEKSRLRWCSFCGNSSVDVFLLIEGPVLPDQRQACICDRCTDKCADLVKERRQKKAEAETPTADSITCHMPTGCRYGGCKLDGRCLGLPPKPSDDDIAAAAKDTKAALAMLKGRA